jgi:guanine deaminase
MRGREGEAIGCHNSLLEIRPLETKWIIARDSTHRFAPKQPLAWKVKACGVGICEPPVILGFLNCNWRLGLSSMPSDPISFVGLRGCVIDAPSFHKLRTWRDGAVVFGNDGKIVEVGDYQLIGRRNRGGKIRWIELGPVAIFPGLIDLHSHVPQYPVVARGRGQLLEWLNRYIFPKERAFTGAPGKREAASFFPQLARNGTTTAALYTTIYSDSTEAAFQAASVSGLRIIMGAMMMDTGAAQQPRKAFSISALETEQLIKQWHGANEGLIEYAVSPRFALSCSEQLLERAGQLAKQYGCYLQTHLAETIEECSRVKHLFPWATDYTHVYEKSGMLTERTILGHCIHLNDRERMALVASNAKIAHCPTANFFLNSGIMPLPEYHEMGLNIGLGTDVAAGPELNLWQVMRSTIESQKARGYYERNIPIIHPSQALYLATQGGAEALCKGHVIGSFDAGKDADITVMNIPALLPYRGTALHADALSAEDVLALCVYRGGPHAVVETMVRGKSVFRAPDPELFSAVS